MKPADHLAEFVGEALSKGKTKSEISAVLLKAGWLETEVGRATASWSDESFPLPVPKPRAIVSARDAFLYAALFTALAYSLWHINRLGFALITLWLPDNVQSEWVIAGSYGAVRWAMATLIVSVPLFVWLNHKVTKAIDMDPAMKRSALRKWFSYITLFLALFVLAADGVATIYAFLSGDLTIQFALKATLVLITVGLVYLYYKNEAEAADAA
jgi:hypothetical protein